MPCVGHRGVEPRTSFLSGKRSTAEPVAHHYGGQARLPETERSMAGRSGKRSTNELSARIRCKTPLYLSYRQNAIKLYIMIV